MDPQDICIVYSAGDMWVQSRRYASTEQEICEYCTVQEICEYRAGDMRVQTRRYVSAEQQCTTSILALNTGHNFVTVSGTTVVLIWNLY